jgi:hypothetical protein
MIVADIDRKEGVPSLPTVADVETAIGLPAALWVDRCHEVSCAMLAASLVVGVERYGHYYGRVSRRYPRYGQPFQRHGWIEQPDGRVVDPTRWVFEKVKPYIYCGSGKDYDAGGQRMRMGLMQPYPAGPRDESSDSPHLTERQREVRREVFQLNVDDTARAHLAELTGGQTSDFNLDQVFWIANLSLHLLGKHAPAIYQALVEIDQRVAIPTDNWRMAMDRPMAAHRPDAR